MDSDNFKNSLRKLDKDDKDSDEKLLASCVDSWENIVDDNGQPIICNEENALKLFKEYPVLKSQTDRFIAERSNYLKK
jgi:hypothetical protein